MGLKSKYHQTEPVRIISLNQFYYTEPVHNRTSQFSPVVMVLAYSDSVMAFKASVMVHRPSAIVCGKFRTSLIYNRSSVVYRAGTVARWLLVMVFKYTVYRPCEL